MRWPWSKKPGSDGERPAGLQERLAALETDLRALRRDVDDLDDSFRSFRGRRFKQDARDKDREEVEATLAAAVPEAASRPNGAPTVGALLQAGRWPFSRR